jgi:hypothetical protein
LHDKNPVTELRLSVPQKTKSSFEYLKYIAGGVQRFRQIPQDSLTEALYKSVYSAHVYRIAGFACFRNSLFMRGYARHPGLKAARFTRHAVKPFPAVCAIGENGGKKAAEPA